MAYLFATLMIFQGKVTFRNLSRYSNVSEKRFSRWYRREFSSAQFNAQLLRQAFSESHEYIPIAFESAVLGARQFLFPARRYSPGCEVLGQRFAARMSRIRVMQEQLLGRNYRGIVTETTHNSLLLKAEQMQNRPCVLQVSSIYGGQPLGALRGLFIRPQFHMLRLYGVSQKKKIRVVLLQTVGLGQPAWAILSSVYM